VVRLRICGLAQFLEVDVADDPLAVHIDDADAARQLVADVEERLGVGVGGRAARVRSAGLDPAAEVADLVVLQAAEVGERVLTAGG